MHRLHRKHVKETKPNTVDFGNMMEYHTSGK